MKRLDKQKYLKILADFEVIKARGKATIISLIKYLKSLGINPIVVHDNDLETANAARFNQNISDVIGINGKIIIMNNTVEDEVGYVATYEKPFHAYKQTESWKNWEAIPQNWRNKMIEIFEPYI